MLKNLNPKIKYIIGIDEVGRGPIAGPFVMCAFVCSSKFYNDFVKRKLKGIRDSKKLSSKNRELWNEKIRNVVLDNKKDLFFVLEKVSALDIDKYGMSKMIKKVVNTLLKKVLKKAKMKCNANEILVLLDGGLYAPGEYIFQKTIIKGDEKEPIIASASIIAKVYRDNLMIQLHKKLPHYNFHKHKGYGTREHYKLIEKHGVSEQHRKTWIKNPKK